MGIAQLLEPPKERTTNVLERHQARIFRNYTRRVSNLLKLKRFAEAEETSIRFTGILRLWEMQRVNIQTAERKGLDRVK